MSHYLEVIFYIDAEGEPVRATRLADWLQVSQPTASVALQRMVRDGLIDISASKVVSLTPLGRKLAARVVRTHRIVERWLTDVLGFDWLAADVHAGALEHAFAEQVTERLYALIGEPSTCPHGNPIPGAKALRLAERSLSTLEPGQTSRVLRISEVTEHETPELLTFLTKSGLQLGAEVRGVEINPGARTQTVSVADHDVTMSLEVAAQVWIEV
ncbi:MAG: metal-dependent transcriptional regulator [Actinomycetota bacterium]